MAPMPRCFFREFGWGVGNDRQEFTKGERGEGPTARSGVHTAFIQLAHRRLW